MKASKREAGGSESKKETSTTTIVVKPLFPAFGFLAVPQMGRQTDERTDGEMLSLSRERLYI